MTAATWLSLGLSVAAFVLSLWAVVENRRRRRMVQLLRDRVDEEIARQRRHWRP